MSRQTGKAYHLYIEVIPPSSRCSLRLRSADTGQLYVPRTWTILGERAFAVAGPRAWNSLPVMVRSAPLLSTFKSHLKTFLFRCAFNTSIDCLFTYIYILFLFVFFFHPYFTNAIGLHLFVVLFSGLEATCRVRRLINCYVTYIHTYIHAYMTQYWQYDQCSQYRSERQ